MKTKQIVWAGVAVAALAAGAAYYFRPQPPAADIATGALLSSIPVQASGDLNRLPTTASAGEAPASGAGGTTANGRIERIWVRLAEGVLIEPSKAPGASGWRYASVEFPDPLTNGTTAVRALIPTGMVSEVGIGDVIEMRFAQKAVRGPMVEGFRALPERDQLTKMMAKSGTQLARDYERRIQARLGVDPSSGGRPDVALWKLLPLDQAIKVVRGGGKRQMALFSDPYCEACQGFEQTLQALDDVTVHIFMLPVIRPDKADASRSVWCSPDRAQAWTDLALRGKEPTAQPNCANPIKENMALLKPVGIRATPTLVFENGQRAQGNLLASAVSEALDRAGAPAQAK